MDAQLQSDDERKKPPISSGIVLLGRLAWMTFGPLLLCLMIGVILTQRSGWFTIWDVGFGAIVLLMLTGRWIEQRSGAATTATGEPATVQHFKRYVRALCPIAGGVWIVVHTEDEVAQALSGTPHADFLRI